MAEITYMGVAADPDQLRALADDAAWSLDWRGRVRALPRGILSRETLAQPPEFIAGRLRQVAEFLERRQRGEPFGGTAFQESIAALQRANEARAERRRRA